MLTIAHASTPEDVQEIQALLREYTAWVFTLSAHSHQAPTFQGLEEELATLPGMYGLPTGRLLLARHDGRAAGCIALKGHTTTTAELKRLYVRPGFRGAKIGWQLVTALVDEARKIGYRRIILDSHMSMTTAHAIYEAAGFRRVNPPGDFPEALKAVVVFMEMDLHEPPPL